jgi:hypothetical protein
VANPNPKPPPEHTRWKPGQSGNPAGHSRGRRATDELIRLIEEKGADRAIATKWLQAMLEGDFRYFAAYLERVEGKVVEIKQAADPDANTIESITQRALDEAADG